MNTITNKHLYIIKDNIYMVKDTIRVLDSNLVEKSHSIFTIKLTYDMWKDKITPWERRRVFHKHGLIYNIGNKKEISDLQLNYNLIVQKINEIKKLNQAFKYLSFAKIITSSKFILCDDLIIRIINT